MTESRGIGDRWIAGEAIAGIDFGLGDAVEIRAGANDGERGTIALLVALRPEPMYVVALRSGDDVRVRQSALRAAG